MCQESIQFSIRVNGDSFGQILSQRELRQGDWLSPYLFILCTKGLSSILKHFKRKGEIHGIKVCRRAPTLSHILFVDDYFLFCRAFEGQPNTLTNILDTYGRASGQLVNFHKSNVFSVQTQEMMLNKASYHILVFTPSLTLKNILTFFLWLEKRRKLFLDFWRIDYIRESITDQTNIFSRRAKKFFLSLLPRPSLLIAYKCLSLTIYSRGWNSKDDEFLLVELENKIIKRN